MLGVWTGVACIGFGVDGLEAEAGGFGRLRPCLPTRLASTQRCWKFPLKRRANARSSTPLSGSGQSLAVVDVLTDESDGIVLSAQLCMCDVQLG